MALCVRRQFPRAQLRCTIGKLRTGDDGLDDEADFQYIIAVAWLANEWMNPLFSFFLIPPVELDFVTNNDIRCSKDPLFLPLTNMVIGDASPPSWLR